MSKIDRLIALLHECIEDAYQTGRKDAVTAIQDAVGIKSHTSNVRVRKGYAESIIRDALEKAENPLTPTQIVKETGYVGSHSGLRAALKRMAQKGEVRWVGKGQWQLIV